MHRAQGLSALKKWAGGGRKRSGQASGVLGAKGGRVSRREPSARPHVHITAAESHAACMLAGFYLHSFMCVLVSSLLPHTESFVN